MEQKALPVRSIVILTFLLLMTTTLACLGFVVYSNWMASSQDFIHRMQDDMNQQIVGQVDDLVSDALHVNDVHKVLIDNRIVDLSDPPERERFFVGVMENHLGSGIYSFSFGGSDGVYYGARLNAQGELEIMRNDATTGGQSWYYSIEDDSTAGELAVQAGAFDPRTRSWYKAAVEAGTNVFSPIYKHFVMDDLTVSAAVPLYGSDGALRGVLGTHMLLSSIDHRLAEAVRDQQGLAILAEREGGSLVANSMGVRNFTVLEDKTIDRVTMEELGDTVVDAAMAKAADTGETSFSVKTKGGSYHIFLTNYQNAGLDWVLLTAIPESIFIGGIVENLKWTLTLTVLALLVSFLIYLVVTRKYLKPLKDIVATTRALSGGALDHRIRIRRNDELGEIGLAFNAMADTIQTMVDELEGRVASRTAALEQATRELQSSKDDLRLILDSAAEAIYGLDERGRCTFCNASCLRILGYKDQNDLLGKDMHEQIHHTKRDGTPMPLGECRIYQSFLSGVGTHVEDEVFWRADGTSFDAEYYSYPQIRDGKIIGSVVTFNDITERKASEARIRHLTYHDTLTGLYNRAFFEEELKRLDTMRNWPLAVVYGDVNGLKLANDVFGHDIGDELLRRVAGTLRRICRADDIVARVGGDEFALLLPRTDEAETAAIAARIRDEFAREAIGPLRCSIAIGYALKEERRASIHEVLTDAEEAMYREKTLHRTKTNDAMLEGIIASFHQRSEKEKEHADGVRALAGHLGKALGLSETQLRQVRDAAYLHDLGKVVLDDDLLLQASVYSDHDREEVQQHAMVGYRILNSFDDTLDLAEAVLSHHERWDGDGYPKGLKGEEIPLLSRILAVAERYDALRSSRYYRGPCSHEESIEEIRKGAGTQFDPAVVDVFLAAIDGYRTEDQTEDGRD